MNEISSLVAASDLLGWLAAGFIVAAYVQQDPVRMRVLALLANVSFGAYGAAMDLTPVLALHLLLLPINAWRLAQLLGWRIDPICFRRT